MHSAAEPPEKRENQKVVAKGCSSCGNRGVCKTLPRDGGTTMKSFLLRFAALVAGVLQGFDRLVLKGKLPQLYGPNGMHAYCGRNRIRREDFKIHADGVTKKLLGASLVCEAKRLNRYLYLNSSKADKEKVAREFAAKHRVEQGLVCVLQCVEPCWTFDIAENAKGTPTIVGERGKCSHLYHYYIDPKFGWMYVRLQTWFPFEIQVGINGREWLSRQMDAEQLSYLRSDNKFLCVADWRRAQQLFDGQLQTDWVAEMDRLRQQVHPLHPEILGQMPVQYNWTVFQSEWATDIAFRSQKVVETWFERWLREAFLSYDSVDVLRFLGRTGRIYPKKRMLIETSVHDRFEGKRIKHFVGHNSLKLYTHANVLRSETTINNAEEVQVFRTTTNDPEAEAAWRPLRRSVVDMPLRAEFGQETNERYLEALATTAETRTIKELAEPLTCRVPGPTGKTGKSPRQVRGLNPLAREDAALLTAVSDPKWMVNGLRNRDLVAMLYDTPSEDAKELRRRSSRITRLLRLLRAHGLIVKIPKTHRYQIASEGRIKIQSLLACRNASPDTLITNAA
jgi:hypothetical protein